MKGQWFIISAVIASSAFLAIAVLFRGYFLVDSSIVTQLDEDSYFNNIKEELYRIKDLDSGCGVETQYERNVIQFAAFAQDIMAKKGYYLFVNYTSICPYTFGILLASERAVFYDNVNPLEVLGIG